VSGFLTPLVRSPQGRLLLCNTRNGRILADALTGAFDSASRNRGLLGRSGLPAGHALVIAPTSAIHTGFMRFPIDVAFVGRDGTVLKVARDLKPWRIAASLRAFAALEFSAGVLAAADTRAGDQLTIQRTDEV
jgi:uncharacterized membrane protein (UPF0127 family)